MLRVEDVEGLGVEEPVFPEGGDVNDHEHDENVEQVADDAATSGRFFDVPDERLEPSLLESVIWPSSDSGDNKDTSSGLKEFREVFWRLVSPSLDSLTKGSAENVDSNGKTEIDSKNKEE